MQRRRSLSPIRPQVLFMTVLCMHARSSGAESVPTTPSILAPVSTPANEIFHLSLFVLLITGAIFVVVGGAAGIRHHQIPCAQE